jgi:hypothetical protein
VRFRAKEEDSMQGQLAFRKRLKEMILARTPLFYLGSIEIKMCLEELRITAANLDINLNVFSLSNGTLKSEGQKTATDPIGILDTILKRSKRSGSERQTIWALPFFHLMLQVPDALILSRLREMIEFNRFTETAVIIGVPGFRLPGELADIPVIEAPLPDRSEIESALGAGCSSDERQRVGNICLGLRMRELEDLFARCLVRHGRLDPDGIHALKAETLTKSGDTLLEIEFPVDRLERVAGIEALKGWLNRRGTAFLNPSFLRERNLPLPKGILLTGVPGCGKSLLCRATAGSWGIPLVRLDPSNLYSSSLGSSERNLNRCLEIASNASPCVLWVDEIEKGFALSDPRTDGGVTSRLLGTFLHFLQERKRPVFVAATSNDIRSMPSEMLRKGRWDEIFFIDLPGREERRSIFQILLKRHLWDLEADDKCLRLSEGFSGAEIEQTVVEASLQVLHQGETLTLFHLQRCLKETIPLSTAMEDKIELLRKWAKGRARPASDSKPAFHSLPKVSFLYPKEESTL